MNLSRTGELTAKEAKPLFALLSDGRQSAELALAHSNQAGDEYIWALQSSSGRLSGRGRLSKGTSHGAISLARVATMVFFGDRIPFVQLLSKLPQTEQPKCRRETFHSDCQEPAAEGLHDEQAWCEAAFVRDERPANPTAYLVRVFGTDRYFGYFNFPWKAGDRYPLKSCHDLRQWANVYIPRMFGKRDVERWVFLERDCFDAFSRAAPDYKRVFASMDFPFQAFQQSSNGHGADAAALQRHRTTGPPDPHTTIWEALRNSIGNGLGRLGLARNREGRWSRADSALIERLRQVLAEGKGEPIDLRKAPSRLTTLKAVLLKRLSVDDPDIAQPSKKEAVDLYLALSRFYRDWDYLDCVNVFEPRPGDTRSKRQRILDCVSAEDAQNAIANNKSILKEELVRKGFDSLF
jgi:hypothetical protein